MKRFSIALLFLLAALATGCEKKTAETKSMDALYAENGVPVTIQTLQTGMLQPEYVFHAPLTGAEETVVSAMIADEVENIFFAVGDHVKKDDIVITFPADNPATPYYQTKTAFEHADATLRRIKNLYDNGGISLQEYENTKTQYEVTRANWDAIQRSIRVKAPIGGTITRLNVRKSDPVRPGDALFTIADTRTLKAEVWATEEQMNNTRKGVSATAVWRDITLRGRIVQADLSLDQKRNAFKLVMEFTNPDVHMPAGVNAEIRIRAGKGSQAMIIDRKNVRMEGDSAFVFVARDSMAVKQPVVLGRRYEMNVEVIRGLEPGDSLITAGLMLLEDNTKIGRAHV
jgi:RND family efflux transporter MFP subunit